MLGLARRGSMEPYQLETLMGTSERGRKRRLFVGEAIGHKILQICVATLGPALIAVYIARAIRADSPVLAAMLSAVGAVLGSFPLSLVLGIALWALIPERQPVDWFNHPERLWPATILTLVFVAFIAVTG